MSGIYIPKIRMPENCDTCPYCFCDLPGDMERNPNCPLIPVPEHGDLIDTRPFEIFGFHNPEPGYDNTFMDGVSWMLDKIDNATVVIPADTEEEE